MSRQYAARPNVMQRLKVAWSVFRRGYPWSQGADFGGRKQQTQAPFTWSAWRENNPQWQTVAFETFVEEGFNRNSIIYSAIMYKARTKMSAPLRAYTGDPRQPEPLPPEHPLTQLVSRPNPQQSWPEFAALMEIYYNLGNSFVLLVRPPKGGTPTAMYNLRPDRVYIIPAERAIKGYLYVPEGLSVRDGLPILAEDMIHVKLPNPSDPLEGMGWGMPPTAIAQSTDVDNDITRFLKLFFQNGAMPLGLLKFDVPMDDGDIAEIKQRWMDMYGGVDNWIDVGVLDQGGSYQRVGSTFDEMGFEGIDERNESRILGPFGVPPILIGTRMGLLRSTYSNYETARRAFWEDTAVPELRLFEKEFQYFLQSDDGGFVAYDLSQVPALLQDVPALIKAAKDLWGMGVPANMALDIAGLKVPEIPGGDISYVGGNLTPVGIDLDTGEESMTGAVEAEDDDRKAKPPSAQTKQTSPADLLETYTNSVGELVSSAVLGEIEQADFEAAMRTVVDDAYPALLALGSEESLPTYTAAELAEYETELETARASIPNLAGDIYQVQRYDGDEGLAQAARRVDVWGLKAAGIFALGQLLRLDDPLLMWLYGDTDHCDDCARLNRQVHRASEWQQSGWRPQGGNLDCNGFRCHCRYDEVPPETPLSGSFAARADWGVKVTNGHMNGSIHKNGASRSDSGH